MAEKKSNNLENDFKKLLSYFESENIKSIKEEKYFNTSSEEKDKKENIVKQNKTKQLIESSVINDFSDIHYLKQEKSLGFDVEKFENLMKTKLVDEKRKLQSYERPYISVSELYTCLRSCYYYRKKYSVATKTQFTFPYLYLIQEVGNSVHSIIQKLYDFDEVEKSILSEKYKVKGRVDSIKNNYLFEIKTIEDSKFNNKFIESHYIQANIYAYILNSEYDYKITNVTIIYVPRSLKKVFPFSLKVNNDSAIEYLSRSLILQECLNLNKIPEPIGSDDEQCKYCSYKSICKENVIKSEYTNRKIKREKEKEKEAVFLL